MRDLGYVEEENLQLEVRWEEGDLKRLPVLAAELVQLKGGCHCRGDFASGSRGQAGDADDSHCDAPQFRSGRRRAGRKSCDPGGNITGLSVMDPGIGEKRIQLLKEIFPSLPMRWTFSGIRTT